MSVTRLRWSAAAAWVALTLSVFFAFDIASGDGVSRWLLTAVLALLPPFVIMILANQEAPSAAAALHVVDRRPS